jgi:hypothetical protein
MLSTMSSIANTYRALVTLCTNRQVTRLLKTVSTTHIRGAQTAVFELDIRISNPPYIDVCQSLASETGLKSRNVEKRINDV